jgi:hypothetical protein
VSAFLLILGNREGLRWVLRNERMAFPRRPNQAVASLAEGDELLLYTTRGCFRNPTRDLGRVMGLAQVTSRVESFDEPAVIGSREFTSGCDLALRSLAPVRAGVPLVDHVGDLAVFPDPASWSAWMRRPLLALPAGDARLLKRELTAFGSPPGRVVDSYF